MDITIRSAAEAVAADLAHRRSPTTSPPAAEAPSADTGGFAGAQGLVGVVVVQVDGEIDLRTGPRLRAALTELLPAPSGVPVAAATALPLTFEATAQRAVVRAVVVDLSEVTFIDSYALGVLVHGHRLARPGGRAYALVATHPLIHSLFAITGLAKVMPLHPDLASAIASLRPADGST